MSSKVDQLRQEVLFYDEQYDLGNPVITDTEYEEKYSELQELEKQEGFVPADSPTQIIVSTNAAGLQPVAHSKPMLSLEKTKDFSELKKWYLKANDTILLQPKFDGASILLNYFNGNLVDALSRGNGYYGYRCFSAIAAVQNIPKSITFKGMLQIRGEAIIPLDAFNRVNNGEFANARALASGTIRLSDASVVQERGLEMHVYDLVSAEGVEFENDTEQLEFLKNLGFPVAETYVFTDFSEIKQKITDIGENIRPLLPFPIDGAVLKCQSLSRRKILGCDSKYQKFGYAFKYPSQEAFTRLKDIKVQIGKHGTVCPVALFDKIELGGSIISKATLHNFQFVFDNNIRIGSRIVVALANDVIPQVVKAYPDDKEQAPWEPPTVCPECGSSFEFVGPNAYCTGLNCPGQQKAQIKHFCSREAMAIEGIGEANISLFYDLGLIKDCADLYTLKQKTDTLLQIEGYGEKKISNLLANIEKSKTLPFLRLLIALNIRDIGKANAAAIVEQFPNIDTLMSTSKEQLCNVEGLGVKRSENIIAFFADMKNKAIIARLKDAGLNMGEEGEEKQEPKNQNILKGKTIVITGTLSKSRSVVEKQIREAGGRPTGSVSKKTTFLILGPDKTGSGKHNKALDLGIPIISEQQFNEILEGRGDFAWLN